MKTEGPHKSGFALFRFIDKIIEKLLYILAVISYNIDSCEPAELTTERNVAERTGSR